MNELIPIDDSDNTPYGAGEVDGLPEMTDTHEFSGDGAVVERCRFCGGYPFDLRHWTI